MVGDILDLATSLRVSLSHIDQSANSEANRLAKEGVFRLDLRQCSLCSFGFFYSFLWAGPWVLSFCWVLASCLLLLQVASPILYSFIF